MPSWYNRHWHQTPEHSNMCLLVSRLGPDTPDLFLVCFLPLILAATDPGAHSVFMTVACSLEKSQGSATFPFMNHRPAPRSPPQQCTQGLLAQAASQCSSHPLPSRGASPFATMAAFPFLLQVSHYRRKPRRQVWNNEEVTEVSHDYFLHYGRFWASEVKVRTTWPGVHVPWSFSG